MASFRNGQWVAVVGDDNFPKEAHKTPDGKYVGIFDKGGTDSTGGVSTPGINIVDAKGRNILVIEDGEVKGNFRVDPSKCDAVALEEASHLPPGRHVQEGFVPKK